MTLKDLKGVIDFTFDLADTEIDASFYIELDEINPVYLSQIEVEVIREDVVICNLTKFLRRIATYKPGLIIDYLDNNYYPGGQKDYLLKQLTKRQIATDNNGDITDDGGEAVYHFINCDMYDFLTQAE